MRIVETYRERVVWPGWFYLLLIICQLLLAYSAIRMAPEHGLLALLPAAILVVVGYVFWRMRFVELEFGPEGAAFGFGGLRRRVPLERIESAEPEAYSVARYMGWGYRFGWTPRDRAYSVIGWPRGVRLVFDDERNRRWTIFLVSRDPEAAVAALKP